MLLILGGGFIATNHLALLTVRDEPLTALWPVAVWIACAWAGHKALSRRLPNRDPLLFPLAMTLAGWGVNLISRLEPAFGTRQAIWLAVGTGLLIAVGFMPRDMRWLRRYRYTWLIGGLALLSVTLIAGTNPSGGGPRLWLLVPGAQVFGGVMPVYFQPSEVLKLLFIAYLASYLGEYVGIADSDRQAKAWRVPTPAFLGPMLMAWGFCMVLLIWQHDLGSATVFFAVFLAMLYVATGRWGYVAGGMALLVMAGFAGYSLFDVVRLRVDIWLNPWPESQGRAFQIVQSLMALAAGGVIGQGIGQGSPGYIPVVHSDCVLAAVAEEWGIAGALGTVILLAVLTLRGLRAATINRLPFRALLATGLSVALGTQALLIMGGILRLAPLTGITLPFVSYGGSSLVSSFAMIGLLLVLSDQRGAAL